MKNSSSSSSSSSSNTASFKRRIEYKKLPCLEAKPTGGFINDLISAFEAKPLPPAFLGGGLIILGLNEKPKRLINRFYDVINQCGGDTIDTIDRFQRFYGPPATLLVWQLTFLIALKVTIAIRLINRKLTPTKRFLIGGLGFMCYVVHRWFKLRREGRLAL